MATGDAHGDWACPPASPRVGHTQRRHKGRRALVSLAVAEGGAGRARSCSLVLTHDAGDRRGETPSAPRGVVTLGAFLSTVLGASPVELVQGARRPWG